MDTPWERPAAGQFGASPPDQGAASTKQPVDRACLPCRQSHLACDSGRPCRRCVTTGRAAQCVDPERRKRGRPPKNKGGVSAAPQPWAQPGMASFPAARVGERPPEPGVRSAGPFPGVAGQPTRPVHAAPPQSLSGSPSSRHESIRSAAPTPTSTRGSYHSHETNSKNAETPFSAPPTATTTSTSGVPIGENIGSLLNVLVGQVRDLKESLKSVQSELKRVNKRQKAFEEQHQKLKYKVQSLIPLLQNETRTAPSSGSMTHGSVMASTSLSSNGSSVLANHNLPSIPYPLPRTTPRTRAEILEYFPLLKSYDRLYSADMPFVIDDFTKPISIVLFVSSFDSLPHRFTPPIVVYVNDAFCNLLRYPLSELLACPVSKFSLPSADMRQSFLRSVADAEPNGVSPVFAFSPFAIKRDGTIIKMKGRNQAFFNEAAQPKWAVLVVDEVSDENVFLEVHRLAPHTIMDEVNAVRNARLTRFWPLSIHPPDAFDASAMTAFSYQRTSGPAPEVGADDPAALGKRKRPEEDGPPSEGVLPESPFQFSNYANAIEQELYSVTTTLEVGADSPDELQRAKLREMLSGMLTSPMPSPPPSSLSDGTDSPSYFSTSIITSVDSFDSGHPLEYPNASAARYHQLPRQ